MTLFLCSNSCCGPCTVQQPLSLTVLLLRTLRWKILRFVARTDGRTDLLTGQTFFNEVKLQVLLLTKLKVVHNNTQYDIQVRVRIKLLLPVILLGFGRNFSIWKKLHWNHNLDTVSKWFKKCNTTLSEILKKIWWIKTILTDSHIGLGMPSKKKSRIMRHCPIPLLPPPSLP